MQFASNFSRTCGSWIEPVSRALKVMVSPHSLPIRALFAPSTSVRVGNLVKVSLCRSLRDPRVLQFSGFKRVVEVKRTGQSPERVDGTGIQFAKSHLIQHLGEFGIFLSEDMREEDCVLNTCVPSSGAECELGLLVSFWNRW